MDCTFKIWTEGWQAGRQVTHIFNQRLIFRLCHLPSSLRIYILSSPTNSNYPRQDEETKNIDKDVQARRIFALESNTIKSSLLFIIMWNHYLQIDSCATFCSGSISSPLKLGICLPITNIYLCLTPFFLMPFISFDNALCQLIKMRSHDEINSFWIHVQTHCMPL